MCIRDSVYGIALGLYLVISHLAGLTTFHIPYLMPFVATKKERFRGEKDLSLIHI